MDLNLILNRLQFDSDVTLGEMLVEGVHQCWTCEDTVRDPGVKVHAQTAIPYGKYGVVVTFSNRFQKPLPLLVDVPMFEGIRIHPGNTSADTDGCILPGMQRLGKSVGQSVIAFNALFPQIRDAIAAKRRVWIEITKGL